MGRLDNLIRHKQKAEILAGIGRTLAAPFPRITAGELLEMMFGLVQSKLLTDIVLPPSEPTLQIPMPGPDGGKDMEEAERMLGYSATIAL